MRDWRHDSDRADLRSELGVRWQVVVIGAVVVIALLALNW